MKNPLVSFVPRACGRVIYLSVIGLLAVCLFADCIPGLTFLSGWATPPAVLFIGLAFAFLFGRPYPKANKKASGYLLQYSVVGLGFGMNLHSALASGREGMLFTIVSVFGTLLLSLFIGRKLLKVDRNTSYLIGTGTAICGGSAIAAVGPVIEAEDSQMSVALGIVFMLNALALFVFPPIGHLLGLGQHEFGTWAAIAIHDTGSVVGAGATYGEEALKVATTVKLTRALWIVPVALLTAVVFRSKGRKITIPRFILFFILALVANTYLLHGMPEVSGFISGVARKSLTFSMFFIGASLSPEVIRSVGLRPFAEGVLLWLAISLIYIRLFM